MSSFAQALDRLAEAQKSRGGVSLYTRFVNRPLGRVLAAAGYALGRTPNQVTAASAAVTVVGLVLLVSGEPTVLRALAVMLLLVLGFALDSADGQLARLTGLGSPAGEWLDHVVDSGKIVAVHAAVLVTAYRFVDVDSAWLLIPLAFSVVGIVTFVGGVLVDLLERIRRASRSAGAPAKSPSALRAIALLPADYGVLALSFVLWGWPPLFLAAYSILLVANVVIMLLLLAKWFRALRSG